MITNLRMDLSSSSVLYPCWQLHTADMSLTYTGCEDRPGRCSNILAAAALPRHQQLLSPGTTYRVGELGAASSAPV